MELTNTCNFKCSFCPQSDPDHFNIVSRSTLLPDDSEFLLRKLREGGVRTDVMHWTLDGEPFLNRHINEIIRRAIKYGWRKFIFPTNGYYCTLRRLESLPTTVPGAAYTLCIDFCSDEVLFETHRGTPGSWKKIRANIAEILKSRDLNHINLEVSDISSFAITDKREIASRLASLEAMFGSHPRIKFNSRIYHNASGLLTGMLEEKKSMTKKYNLCPYPWMSLFVASNGDVVACCRDLQHKTVLGNLFSEELRDIWNGQRYQNLRSALASEKPQCMGACSSCDMPFDRDKFSFRHMARTVKNRLGVFK